MQNNTMHEIIGDDEDLAHIMYCAHRAYIRKYGSAATSRLIRKVILQIKQQSVPLANDNEYDGDDIPALINANE